MSEIIVGQKIPDVVFHTRRDHEWVDVTSQQVFKGKTVVLFALPGAFTPTCSSSHVPRYNQLAPLFKAHGVDEIVCLSVNDAFVMNEWQAEQNADNLLFLPDGNGEFTRAMGMLAKPHEGEDDGDSPCRHGRLTEPRRRVLNTYS